MRKLIMQSLPTDADLEAFISDHFPEVHQRCSLGMQRVQKVTLLLDIEPDRERILQLLPPEPAHGDVQLRVAGSSLKPSAASRLLLYSVATLLVGLGGMLLGLLRPWAPAPIAAPAKILDSPPAIKIAKEPSPPPASPPALEKSSGDGITVINSSRVHINTNGKAK